MAINPTAEQLLALIDSDRILALEQSLIRIPSSHFQEQVIADYLADYMSELGLDVEMMTVPHPYDSSIPNSRQPIGRLTGKGGGRCLKLNAHMDPGVEMTGWSVDPYAGLYEDGWIWGRGAHDDKGGIAVALGAVEAVIRSGIELTGDVLVCPVVAHKLGGAGTRALLAHGVTADLCINLEHSANTIASVAVGMIRGKIKTTSGDLFFRYSDEAKSNYFNPIEQQALIMQNMGPSLDAIEPGGWLSFQPHVDLPGFPKIMFDAIVKDHYYYASRSDLTTRECELYFQIRTVPGMTLESARADVGRLLDGIREQYPAFHSELTMPVFDTDGWLQDPVDLRPDDPLVKALAYGHTLAAGTEPDIGGVLRIGNVGDGNILHAAGIPSIQYGPGDIRLYDEWPSPDERVLLEDLVTAAGAVSIAITELCA